MATLVVETGAANVIRVKGSLFHHTINMDLCEGCGICVAVCPYDCIAMHHLVPYYVSLRAPHCIRCGACRTACPKGAITRTKA